MPSTASLREEGHQLLASWFTSQLASDSAPVRTGPRLFGKQDMQPGSSGSLGALVESLVDMMWRSLDSSNSEVCCLSLLLISTLGHPKDAHAPATECWSSAIGKALAQGSRDLQGMAEHLFRLHAVAVKGHHTPETVSSGLPAARTLQPGKFLPNLETLPGAQKLNAGPFVEPTRRKFVSTNAAGAAEDATAGAADLLLQLAPAS